MRTTAQTKDADELRKEDGSLCLKNRVEWNQWKRMKQKKLCWITTTLNGDNVKWGPLNGDSHRFFTVKWGQSPFFLFPTSTPRFLIPYFALCPSHFLLTFVPRPSYLFPFVLSTLYFVLPPISPPFLFHPPFRPSPLVNSCNSSKFVKCVVN